MTQIPGNPIENTPPRPETPAVPAAPVKQKNTVGLVALILAVAGFIFACVPGALIVGWILLPVAFILSLVSFFMKGKPKKLGVAALIISVVGTIVGVIVFFSVVVTSIDEAFSDGEVTVTEPSEAETEEEDSNTASEDSDKGTRANPYPIGTGITQGDWTVTVNSVNLDAASLLTTGDLFNNAPEAGMTYIMINLTATYNGTDPNGESVWTTVSYVTPEGVTIDSTDSFLDTPERFDNLATLFEGASTSGNIALEVPADTAAQGVLAVTATMMGDKVFVAVQ